MEKMSSVLDALSLMHLMGHSVEDVQQTAEFMNQELKKDLAWKNTIESHQPLVVIDTMRFN